MARLGVSIPRYASAVMNLESTLGSVSSKCRSSLCCNSAKPARVNAAVLVTELVTPDCGNCSRSGRSVLETFRQPREGMSFMHRPYLPQVRYFVRLTRANCSPDPKVSPRLSWSNRIQMAPGVSSDRQMSETSRPLSFPYRLNQ